MRLQRSLGEILLRKDSIKKQHVASSRFETEQRIEMSGISTSPPIITNATFNEWKQHRRLRFAVLQWASTRTYASVWLKTYQTARSVCNLFINSRETHRASADLYCDQSSRSKGSFSRMYMSLAGTRRCWTRGERWSFWYQRVHPHTSYLSSENVCLRISAYN